MYFDLPYKFPLFTRWANKEISKYFFRHEEDFRRDPGAPPRKGIPPGKEYPFSWTKYEAAVYSVLYGTRYTGFKLNDILGRMDSPPSSGLFRVWRSEARFKALVKKLKEEFTKYMAHNIFYGGDEPLPDDYPGTKTEGLQRKIAFIREGLQYSPDLMGRISAAISDCLDSEDNDKQISNYLGYYLWAITLLHPLRYLGKKSAKRAFHLDVCRKIIGRHWRDEFLLNYFNENAPPRGRLIPEKDWAPRFRISSKNIESDLMKEEAPWMFIQNAYREELAAILNGEILKMAKLKNKGDSKLEVDPNDITTGVDFLAGRIKFYRSE